MCIGMVMWQKKKYLCRKALGNKFSILNTFEFSASKKNFFGTSSTIYPVCTV